MYHVCEPVVKRFSSKIFLPPILYHVLVVVSADPEHRQKSGHGQRDAQWRQK